MSIIDKITSLFSDRYFLGTSQCDFAYMIFCIIGGLLALTSAIYLIFMFFKADDIEKKILESDKSC